MAQIPNTDKKDSLIRILRIKIKTLRRLLSLTIESRTSSKDILASPSPVLLPELKVAYYSFIRVQEVYAINLQI